MFMPYNKLTAATDKIDSLKQLINSTPGEKKTVDNLIILAQAYFDKYLLDSGLYYAKRSLALSTSLDYREGIAESHYKCYIGEYRRDNFNAAKESLKRFNQLSYEINDEYLLGKGLYSYGVLLGQQGMPDSADYYIRKSLIFNLKFNDTMRLIATYNGMGSIFNDQSISDSALIYFLKAARLAELSGQVKYLGQIYNNIGKAYTEMFLYDKAKQFLEQALLINQNKKNIKGIVQSLSNLGSNYLQAGEIDKALYYFDQAAEEIKPLGECMELGDLYNNYAQAHELLGKTDMALDFYKKAYLVFLRQDYIEGITVVMKNFGEIYTKKGEYKKAEAILDSALEIAARAGYDQNRRILLWGMMDNYYKAGDYKNAVDYYDKYHTLYDSMLNVEKVKALDELEKKYQKEKDEARILSLEKENLKKTIQRNVILYTGSAILSLALFTLLFLRQRAHKDRIIAQHKIKQLEEEKKLMSARLLVEGQEQERKRIARELHDGLGVLLSAARMQFTSIKDLSDENKPLMERATQLLEQATSDVRRVSHNMMPGLLTKLGFFEAVEDLIENIGETEGLKASCEIEGDQDRLPENKEIMLYRVVQEMVNNTLKHAKAKNISLKIKRLDNLMVIIYTDDGIGFDPDKLSEGSRASIGLQSIQSRIDFLGGKLEIESSQGSGARYHLQIPL
jgi:signal transduction histidine kinase